MNTSSIWSKNTEFRNGVLHCAGVSVVDIAREFGTPTFVLDEDAFRARAIAWRDALAEEFGDKAGQVFYASKAFTCTAVAAWIKEMGIGIDVSTGGEMAVALAGGINPSHIQVHGNNKSQSEIDHAVDIGVHTIVIDSLYEIDRVADAARARGKRQEVLIRLTPGIEAHTHEKISTAHEDVKFGFSISSGAAWEAVEKIEAASDVLNLRGVHAHIGSQIFGTEAFEIEVERLLAFMGRFRDSYGRELPELDLGGGYGIAYLPGEQTVEPVDVLPTIGAAVRRSCQELSLSIPTISIEPGRNIVGPTMFTLYEVGTVKQVQLDGGVSRTYVSVDGGMSDNIRTSLYEAQYFATIAQRISQAPTQSTRIVGKHCETGDIVINDIALASDIVPGDLLATPATGAYGRSMASNYNHVPRPPVIAVRDGKARILVRRETIADLLALDVSTL